MTVSEDAVYDEAFGPPNPHRRRVPVSVWSSPMDQRLVEFRADRSLQRRPSVASDVRLRDQRVATNRAWCRARDAEVRRSISERPAAVETQRLIASPPFRGTPFRQWRCQDGRTLAEISDLVGLPVLILEFIEEGALGVTPRRQDDIARGLGVSPASLWGTP